MSNQKPKDPMNIGKGNPNVPSRYGGRTSAFTDHFSSPEEEAKYRAREREIQRTNQGRRSR